jgi:hypothetical protein
MTTFNGQTKTVLSDGLTPVYATQQRSFFAQKEDAMEEIPYGYCHCGCGALAPIAKHNHRASGIDKGSPMNFIFGHNSRGSCNHTWIGGRRVRSDGYIYLWIPGYHRSSKNYVMEHIVIAETALGHHLPKGAEVHHANEKRGDNSNGNLVICQDVRYHRLLHRRLRAMKACGHADWKQCVFCKIWDDPKNMFINSQKTAYHVPCERENQRSRRIAKLALKGEQKCQT